MRLAFPITLIVLDFCAAGVYVFYGDLVRAGYWASAGMINLFAVLLK